MEIILVIANCALALYAVHRYNKLEKEYNELVDEYNALEDENTQIRKEIEKVKWENQDLVQIILKHHEK